MTNATNATNGKFHKAAVREEKGEISLSNTWKIKNYAFSLFVAGEVQNEDLS